MKPKASVPATVLNVAHIFCSPYNTKGSICFVINLKLRGLGLARFPGLTELSITISASRYTHDLVKQQLRVGNGERERGG